MSDEGVLSEVGVYTPLGGLYNINDLLNLKDLRASLTLILRFIFGLLEKLCSLIPADLSTERWLKVETITRFANSQVYAWWLNIKATRTSSVHCISDIVSINAVMSIH